MGKPSTWNQSIQGDPEPFSMMSWKGKNPREAWLKTPSSTTLIPRVRHASMSRSNP